MATSQQLSKLMAITRRAPYGDPKKSPYKQSRSSLREQFGSRAIDASTDPIEGPGIATNPRTNLAVDDKWDDFFSPSQSLSDRGRGMLGRLGPRGQSQSAGSTIAAGASAPATTFAPTGYEHPLTPIPANRPLAAAPVDYLKTAMDKSTSFWNQMGVKIPAPIAGQVQAGTSFSGSQYQTPGTVGRVDSGGLLARQKAASQWSGLGAADLKKLQPSADVDPSTTVDPIITGNLMARKRKNSARQWSGYGSDDLMKL